MAFPANVLMIFNHLIPVVMFDIFEFFNPVEYLKFDEEKIEKLADEKIYDQMNDLGYENHNSMLVLGSITVFIVWWIIKVIFVGTLYLMRVTCRIKKGKRF